MIPNDIETLKELHKKLKDKEIKLEADLAIRECPELEELILKIMFVIQDLRDLDNTASIRTKIKPTEEQLVRLKKSVQFFQSKIDTFKQQDSDRAEKLVAFYEVKMKDRQEMLEGLKNGRTAENVIEGRLRAERLMELHVLVEDAEEFLKEYGFGMKDLVLSLQDYLGQYRRYLMLVLSRRVDEVIKIGDNIEVMVVEIRGDRIRLGISAPREISVHRQEVYDAIRRDNNESRD